MQTKTLKLTRARGAGLIFYLTLLSILLWVVAINSTSITYTPPDAFYYFKMLPPIYWVGILAAMLSLFLNISQNDSSNDHFVLIPLVVLALYLYGLPSFIYENPAYYDSILHGGRALPILRSGGIGERGYSNEYPGLFIWTVSLSLIGDINLQTIIKFYPILTIFLLVLFVYVSARIFASKYAFIAPLAVMGVFWANEGHYSPQGYALPLFLLFLFSVIKVLECKKRARGFTLLSILSLATVIISHPITPVFIFAGLSGILLYNIIHPTKTVSNILMLNVCITLAWLSFKANTYLRLISNIVIRGTSRLIEFSTSFSPPSMIRQPTSGSYMIIMELRAVITAFVIISGLILALTLFKMKAVDRGLKVTTIWFLGILAMTFVPSIFLLSSSSLLQRPFLYMIFPWSFLLAFFFMVAITHSTYRKRMKRFYAMIIIAFITSSVLLLPISRNSSDTFTYIPSSELHSAYFLVNTGVYEVEEPTLIAGRRHAYLYAGLLLKNKLIAFKGGEKTSYYEDLALKMKYQLIAINEVHQNQDIVRGRINFASPIETIAEERYNLIYNSGKGRIFSKLSIF